MKTQRSRLPGADQRIDSGRSESPHIAGRVTSVTGVSPTDSGSRSVGLAQLTVGWPAGPSVSQTDFTAALFSSSNTRHYLAVADVERVGQTGFCRCVEMVIFNPSDIWGSSTGADKRLDRSATMGCKMCRCRIPIESVFEVPRYWNDCYNTDINA